MAYARINCSYRPIFIDFQRIIFILVFQGLLVFKKNSDLPSSNDCEENWAYPNFRKFFKTPEFASYWDP